jgi:hypothetical protein
VSWRLNLDNRRLLLMDGTGDAEELAALAADDAGEITPPGRLELKHPITQYPVDLSKSRAPNVIRGYLVAVMERMPEYTRIGVIGHKSHVKALLDDPESPHALPDLYRRRIAKHSYFGAGSDRGSNDWHTSCDLLLILGTPRPNAAGIRQKMAILNLPEAAGPRGQWGDLTWDATTVDGKTARIETRGYAEPVWQRFYAGLTRGAIRQAVGRARSTLEEGIPTVVLTKEPMGYFVDMDKPTPRGAGAQRILEEMHGFTGEIAANDPRWKKLTTPRILSENSLLGGDFRLSVSLRAIAERLGIPDKTARNCLGDLVAEGALHRPARAFYALGPAPLQPTPVEHYCLHADTKVHPITGAPADELAWEAVLEATRRRPGTYVETADITAAAEAEAAADAAAQERQRFRAIRKLQDSGRLIKVRRGVYLANDAAAGTQRWAAPDRKSAVVLLPPDVAGEIADGGALLISVQMVKGEVVVEQRKA